LALMAVPSAIEEGASGAVASPNPLMRSRIYFLLLSAMGLLLTYVGWKP
jgi:hypothetical protein